MKGTKLRKFAAGIILVIVSSFLAIFAPNAHAAVATITSISTNLAQPPGNVVITGTGLNQYFTTVKFGSTATTFTQDSATQITAAIPSGTGTVGVTVSTPDGTSNAIPFTYGTPPPPKHIVGPGSSIWTDDGPFGNPTGSWCTLGAIGRDDLGNLVGITAGHCNTFKGTHQPVELAPCAMCTWGPVIGTFETSTTNPLGQTLLPVDSSLDYGVILFDENVVQASLTTPSGHVLDKNYTGAITPGMGMAHYGQVSQWLTGSVSAYCAPAPAVCGSGQGVYNNVIYSGNVSNIPGDSGGPVRIGGVGYTCPSGCGFAGVNSAINPFSGSPGAFQFTGIAGILADIASQGPATIGIGFEPSL